MLAAWCSDNQLNLKTGNTKEIVNDFWKSRSKLQSGLDINEEEEEQVTEFQFQRPQISEDCL